MGEKCKSPHARLALLQAAQAHPQTKACKRAKAPRPPFASFVQMGKLQ